MTLRRTSLALSLLATASCGGDGGSSAPAIVDFDVPRNPNLGTSTWPIFHRDSYAQHSSDLRGVEGGGTITVDLVPTAGIPVFTFFDATGDILVVAKTLARPNLVKIDRETLTVVDTIELPGGGVFGGAYGFLDAMDRAVVANGTVVQRLDTAGDTLAVQATVDLASSLAPGETLAGIMPTYAGQLVFVGDFGTVGYLAPTLDGAPLDVLQFPGEAVDNGMTTDETGGIYLVTSAKLRRLEIDGGGSLVERWSYDVGAPYATPRPGRLGIGSGTTPSLIMDDMVTVADDEETMNLRVVRRQTDLGGAPREVCKVPVFDHPGTTDNAIVVAGRTLIIEENLIGQRGVARFDIVGDRCQRTWVSDVLGPNCVPTLSKPSELVYVYTYDDQNDVWGLSGLDLETGETRFYQPSGEGLGYDSRYAAVTVGPDERIYIGTFSGLLVFADAP